ncbi:MAG: hypothetical protein COB49_09805 [Alphaproteobacteria bacterium]|nr:MAG: hypothetical protein COB49_09805 [Alphaproteobacteria bacterium]
MKKITAILPTKKTATPHRAILLSLGLLLGSSILTPAMAAGDERLTALESKLNQAMNLIISLQKEIGALKKPTGGSDVKSGNMGKVVQTVQENTERLNDVEDLVLDLEDKTGSRALVKAFDALSIDIGGFLHSAVTYVDGEDGSATSFNRQTFELLLKAELGQSWSAFIAQAFIRESAPIFQDAEGRTDPTFRIPGAGISPTVIAWANYKSSDALNIRLGRFITPHGIINVDHFPAALLDPEQPQFLRPFGGQTIFANFMTGVNIHGQKFSEGGTLKYDLYVGNFVGNPKNLNYGGRVAYNIGNSGITIGANIGGGRRTSADAIGGASSDYLLYGGDLLYDKGKILWKSELFVTDEDLGEDRLAFYTQPAYRINDKWMAFYRFDFLDDGTGTGDKTEHAFGINYRPIQSVVLRSVFTLKEFDGVDASSPLGPLSEANVNSLQLSATFSF